ncbi:putative membrane protein [Acinetobacter baumannii 1106579]|nr:hypothetical protein ACINNAV82_3345 [Acinetobacter baumannii Naval-82]EXE18992.1 putative membrane protein [Acinetobacter baumannii 1106579]EXE80137.1 putative membrane protein [Acinetobacter baumannii 83444]KMV26079.1 putative membrane protein [Acinetobacter baumannii]
MWCFIPVAYGYFTSFSAYLFYPITALIILCIPFICNNVGYSVFAMGIVYTLRLFISNKFMENIEPKQV